MRCNGIQALDLVGRKLAARRRARGDGILQRGRFYAKDHGADEAMKPYVAPLSNARAICSRPPPG